MAEKEGTLSFSDLGIHRAQNTTDTCWGKAQSCQSLTWKEIIFLVISVSSIVGAIAITIQKLATTDPATADFTFAIVLLINSLFCLYYILGGVFLERPYELAVLVVATAIVWLYLVINYAISKKGPFKLARLIAASVLGPATMVLGALLIKTYSESKNLIFRTVGAKAALQDICNTLFVFIGLLKGDLQVNLSMSVLIMTSGKDIDLEDKIILPLILGITVISTVIGYVAVRFENRIIAIVYAVLWILIPAYAIYLIVKSVGDLRNHSNYDQMHKAIRGITLIAAAISLVVRGLLLFYGFRVYLNFGKGLKDKVFKNQAPDAVRSSNTATQNEIRSSASHVEESIQAT